ncbi:MAG: hypothetical protein SFU27_10600 [Thermonemataceae bacterium]|nr:hypothetical protein [Thermonemataceae bacterium]
MKKNILIWLFLFSSGYSFSQNTLDKAKLEVLCQAIRFSHIMQNKAEIANSIDCSSLQTLDKTIPQSSKASKQMFKLYLKKTYREFPSEEVKIKKMKAEVFADLRKLGMRINKTAASQDKWLKGLDSLSNLLDEKLSLQRNENTTTDTQNTNDSSLSDNSLDETVIPLEQNPTPKTDSPHTGLWIISILAILLAFLAVGYAYLTQKTTAHKLREMENLVKERYQHLDTRMDKMLTRDEFKKNTNI